MLYTSPLGGLMKFEGEEACRFFREKWLDLIELGHACRFFEEVKHAPR